MEERNKREQIREEKICRWVKGKKRGREREIQGGESGETGGKGKCKGDYKGDEKKENKGERAKKSKEGREAGWAEVRYRGERRIKGKNKEKENEEEKKEGIAKVAETRLKE